MQEVVHADRIFIFLANFKWRYDLNGGERSNKVPHESTCLGRLFQRRSRDASQETFLTLEQVGLKTMCALISRLGRFGQELEYSKPKEL